MVEILDFHGNVPGVSDKVGHKVQDMLAGGRRYFGSAGASLTQHVNDPDFISDFSKGHVKAGLEAERDTSLRLQRWAKDKPSVVLADSVHIVGAGKETINPETGLREGGDTDHVLIIGNDVILIDTKRWKSKRKYTVSSKGSVLRQGRSFGGGQVHAGQARYLWKNYLVKGARVSAIVCINSEKVFVPYDANWKKQPYRLITVENLTDTLDRRYQKMKPEETGFINPNIVAQVVLCCVPPFDAYERVFNMETLKSFR